MVNIKQIILYPLITEDAVNQIESENKLMFIVSRRANKSAVKTAVEELYEVKVEKVNLLITSKGLKKAFVKLTSEFKASDLAIKLGIF
ncbi:MAG: 50S ribosomal protein L23 [Candidatus Bathyarchaeota archaeon]